MLTPVKFNIGPPITGADGDSLGSHLISFMTAQGFEKLNAKISGPLTEWSAVEVSTAPNGSYELPWTWGVW
jgi:hypothetical protein